jgi:uncharacterized membrane protein
VSATLTFRRWRWPAVALVASLVLNGFLIGMLATNALAPKRGGFNGERFARFELRRIGDKLPKPAIDQIATTLKPLGPQLDERLGKLRAIRAEVMKLAAAPAPDRAAIDAKLTELRTETSDVQEVIQRATYDALLGLPADQRKRLADGPNG